MAGRPFLQKISREIDTRGGETWFFGLVADGIPMRSIAKQLGCSRDYLYQWIHKDPRRGEALDAARKLTAVSKAEDGEAVLDDLHSSSLIGLVTSVDVQLATQRAAYKRWLAEKYNRPVYGAEKSQTNIQLNIGDLHAEALRARSPRAIAAPVVDATFEIEP